MADFREGLTMQISIPRTIVTAVALHGMALGGAFGYAAGQVAPGLFEYRVIPLEKIDPIAKATVLCAAGGMFCGGTLGAFAIMVQTIVEWKRKS